MIDEGFDAFLVAPRLSARTKPSEIIPRSHLIFRKGTQVPKIAEGLRANGCTHVETGLIPGSVHYVVEDQPETVADLIERYASAHSE